MVNTYNFSPQGGNIIGADNQMYNIVDLLGGGTPVDTNLYDITQFQPKCGLIVGSDNRLYDAVALLQGLAAKKLGIAVVDDETGHVSVTAEYLEGVE